MKKLLLALSLLVVPVYPVCLEKYTHAQLSESIKLVVDNYLATLQEIDYQIEYYRNKIHFCESAYDKELNQISLMIWLDHKNLILNIMEDLYPYMNDIYPHLNRSAEQEFEEILKLYNA